MTDTTRRPRRAVLDDLALAMAAATDTGDLTRARRILHRLEAAVGIADEADDPAPVLARRFARAYREALRLHGAAACWPLDDPDPAISPEADGRQLPRPVPGGRAPSAPSGPARVAAGRGRVTTPVY